MIKNKFVILFFCLCAFNLSAQSKNDVDYLVKMQLFLNKENVFSDKLHPNIVKGDSLFHVFKDLIILKIDTLKVENGLAMLHSDDYSFYRVKESNIKYTKQLVKQEVNYFAINTELSDGEYIISINQNTGRLYRLAGFGTNDFMGFLTDFKDMYLNSNFKKLSTSKFFKNYIVQDLDFKCLYKGLRCGNSNSNKYPCLMKCNDPIRIAVESK
ncbi:MAG: hypothetical protein QM710_05990 [Flavobacterium sp.]